MIIEVSPPKSSEVTVVKEYSPKSCCNVVISVNAIARLSTTKLVFEQLIKISLNYCLYLYQICNKL